MSLIVKLPVISPVGVILGSEGLKIKDTFDRVWTFSLGQWSLQYPETPDFIGPVQTPPPSTLPTKVVGRVHLTTGNSPYTLTPEVTAVTCDTTDGDIVILLESPGRFNVTVLPISKTSDDFNAVTVTHNTLDEAVVLGMESADVVLIPTPNHWRKL